MIRTFIALEIPFEELSKIIQLRDKFTGLPAGIRWEPEDKLHITLKFLGDTEEKLIDNIKNELHNILDMLPALRIRFSKFGIFKKENDPRILWVGINESPELSQIVEKIDNSFTKFGYTKESRKFKPHITLLRFKGREDKQKVLKLLEVTVQQDLFKADSICLFKSELKPSGSVYTSLEKYLLK